MKRKRYRWWVIWEPIDRWWDGWSFMSTPSLDVKEAIAWLERYEARRPRHPGNRPLLGGMIALELCE